MLRDAANRTRCKRSNCRTNAGVCRQELEMKHLFALSGFAVALGVASLTASAQSTPPSLPPLTQAQSQELATRMDSYRRATDARVAQNEITADEGARLVQWREWQIARQIAAATPAPPPAATSRTSTDYPPV